MAIVERVKSLIAEGVITRKDIESLNKATLIGILAGEVDVLEAVRNKG